MSRKNRFEQRYKDNQTPWELGRPDKYLMELVQTWPVAPCRALDIGCGTGTHAIWLAQQDFEVTGVDFSPLAVKQAQEQAEKSGLNIRFKEIDFLSDTLEKESFDFVFDRGCFHIFDQAGDREKFARNVHSHLREGGKWFSLLGNKDDPPREEGPPMRTAHDIISGIEPWFRLLYLKAGVWDSKREKPARSWQCLMEKRPLVS